MKCQSLRYRNLQLHLIRSSNVKSGVGDMEEEVPLHSPGRVAEGWVQPSMLHLTSAADSIFLTQ